MMPGKEQSKIPIAIALILLLAFSYVLFNPSIVGFLVAQPGNESIYNVNTTFNESGAFGFDVSGELNSLKIDATVHGSGTARIYLEDKGIRRLIAESLPESGSVPTGFVVVGLNDTANVTTTTQNVVDGNVSSNITFNLNTNATLNITTTTSITTAANATSTTTTAQAIDRVLESSCVETCTLPGLSSTRYAIVVELQNATIGIERLKYTATFAEAVKPTLHTDKDSFALGEIVKINVTPDIYYTLSVIDGVNYRILTKPEFTPEKPGTYTIRVIGVFENKTIALNKNITVVEALNITTQTTVQIATTVIQNTTTTSQQTTTTALQNLTTTTIPLTNSSVVFVKRFDNITISRYTSTEVNLDEHFRSLVNAVLTYQLVFVDKEPLKILDQKLLIQPNIKTVKIIATDGNATAESNVFTITILEGLEGLIKPNVTVSVNITYNLTQIVFNFTTDRQVYFVGEIVKFNITPTNATSNITASDGLDRFNITGLNFTPIKAGNYTIDAMLRYKNQSKLIIRKITVIENIAPVLIKPVPDITIYVNDSFGLNLSEYFGGSGLKYSVNSTLLDAAVNNDIMVLKGIKAGNETMTITASDGINKIMAKVKVSVAVNVAPSTEITRFLPPSTEITRFAGGEALIEFRLGNVSGISVVPEADKTAIVFNFPNSTG
jgi:hypothetical protein